MAEGDGLGGFGIAGADGKFFRAEARVDGDSVILAGNKVEKPVSARYGRGLKADLSLYNKADLPAAVFEAGEIMTPVK